MICDLIISILYIVPSGLGFTATLTERSILVEWQVIVLLHTLVTLALCTFVYTASSTDRWSSSHEICCILQFQ